MTVAIAATVAPSGSAVVVEARDGSGALVPLTGINTASVQSITVKGAGGTYTLSHSGHTTAPIPAGSTAATVQPALQGLASIGPGKVIVSGVGNPFTLSFDPSLGVVPLVTVDGSGLTTTPASTPDVAGSGSPVVVSDTSVGFSTSGPVAVYPSGFGLQRRVVSRAGTASGPSSVTWSLSGLAAGNYLVQADWIANFFNPSDAPFRFYDGSTYRGMIRVDMTPAPPGATTVNDGTADFVFGTLATVYVGTGPLSVVFGDDFSQDNHTGAGNSGTDYGCNAVAVDAIRVSPAAAGTLTALSEPVAATSAITFAGGFPTPILNGVTPVTLTGPIWAQAERNLPYAVFLSTTPIAGSDSVAFSSLAGAFATSAGASAAIAGLACANLAGLAVPAPPPGPRTLKVGYNIEPPTDSQCILTYCDLMRCAGPWSGLAAADLDANGYPTSPTTNTTCWLAVSPGNPIDSKGYRHLPETNPGNPAASDKFCVRYSGTGTVTLYDLGNAHIVPFAGLSVDPPGNIDRLRYFDVTRTDPTTTYAPSIGVWITGRVTDAHVYPPGVATDGSQLFHPQFLRMLAGAASLRSMDALTTNGSTVIEYADFAKQNQRSYFGMTERNPAAAIAKIEPWVDSPGNLFHGFYRPVYMPIKVTTAAPHGFRAGQTAYFGNPGGIPINLTGDTPTTVDLNLMEALVLYDPATMSTSEFVTGVYVNDGAPVMTGTYTGGGTATVYNGYGMPPEDIVDLCNAIGADLWLNVPHGASDDCVNQLATMVAGRLHAGLKCRVELSNEHWNSAGAFNQFRWFEGMGRIAVLSTSRYYAQRANHFHNLFATAFAPAGRAGDLVRLMGCQAGAAGGPAADLVPYCKTNVYPIDALAIAPYMAIGPQNEPGMDATYAALTPDQVMDLSWAWTKYTDSGAAVRNHYAILAQDDGTGHPMFPSATVVCYEGGPAMGSLGTGGSTVPAVTKAAQSQGWHNHPRLRGDILAYLRQMEVAGCPLFNDFNISNPYGNEGGTGVSTYGSYIGWDQMPGLGDGSDGLFDNRTALLDSSRVVSVVGGALADWASGAAGPAPPSSRARQVGSSRLRTRRGAA